jgi:hypothetical protein
MHAGLRAEIMGASSSPPGLPTDAWRSDRLVPLQEGKGPQPRQLDLTLPNGLAESDGETLSLSGHLRPALEARILTALASVGFDRTSSRPVDRTFKWKGVTRTAGSLGVAGERNVRVDATRESAIRMRMVTLVGVVLFVVSLWLTGQSTVPRILTIPIILGAGACLAGAMISLGSDSFWSDLVLVYCSPAETAGGPQTAITSWRVDVRAATVRSENWASKTGSGRTVKESHRNPGLSGPLTSTIDALRGEGTPLPS